MGPFIFRNPYGGTPGDRHTAHAPYPRVLVLCSFPSGRLRWQLITARGNFPASRLSYVAPFSHFDCAVVGIRYSMFTTGCCLEDAQTQTSLRVAFHFLLHPSQFAIPGRSFVLSSSHLVIRSYCHTPSLDHIIPLPCSEALIRSSCFRFLIFLVCRGSIGRVCACFLFVLSFTLPLVLSGAHC